MFFVQVLRWSDYCLPLAYSPGQPFRVVAQTSLENFSLLGVAFIEDRLHLDNGLVPSKIVRMLLSVPDPHCQHTELTLHFQFCLHYVTEKQNYVQVTRYIFNLNVLPHFAVFIISAFSAINCLNVMCLM